VCFVSAVTTSDRDNSSTPLPVLLQVAAAANCQAMHACHHRPIGSACERHTNPAVQAPSLPPGTSAPGFFGPTEARFRAISHMGKEKEGWIFYTHQWIYELTKYECWGIRSCQVFFGHRFGSYKKLIVADLQQLQGTPREIKRAGLSTCFRDKLSFDLLVDQCCSGQDTHTSSSLLILLKRN